MFVMTVPSVLAQALFHFLAPWWSQVALLFRGLWLQCLAMLTLLSGSVKHNTTSRFWQWLMVLVLSLVMAATFYLGYLGEHNAVLLLREKRCAIHYACESEDPLVQNMQGHLADCLPAMMDCKTDPHILALERTVEQFVEGLLSWSGGLLQKLFVASILSIFFGPLFFYMQQRCCGGCCHVPSREEMALRRWQAQSDARDAILQKQMGGHHLRMPPQQ